MELDESRIKVNGIFPRIAQIEDEEIESVHDPLAYLPFLLKRPRKADLFTFMQVIPQTQPQHPGLYMEWDNVAAIPISTYDYWWNKQVNFKLRNKVRKLEKKGGEVRISEYDDDFVTQIMDIYNETPIRQGRKFWHYQKTFDAVKKENGTYPDRSVLLGAYHDGRLIGFLRFICNPAYATIVQIISKVRERDKAPTNALLAKAVEVCADRNIPYLVYAKFIYGKKGKDSLSEFKQHNGFIKLDLPRYYIPLTLRGRLALKMKVHHGFAQLLPSPLTLLILRIRSKWNERRHRPSETDTNNPTE